MPVMMRFEARSRDFSRVTPNIKAAVGPSVLLLLVYGGASARGMTSRILCSSVLEKSNHSKNTTVIVTLRDSIKKAKSRKAAVRILEWNAEKNRFDVKLISSSESRSRYVDNLQVRFH